MCIYVCYDIKMEIKEQEQPCFSNWEDQSGMEGCGMSIDLFLNASYLFSSHYQSIDLFLIIDTHDTISTFPMFMHQ